MRWRDDNSRDEIQNVWRDSSALLQERGDLVPHLLRAIFGGYPMALGLLKVLVNRRSGRLSEWQTQAQLSLSCSEAAGQLLERDCTNFA